MVCIKKICKDIEANGGKAMIVGGFVRDMLMGKTPKDADIEVYGLSLKDLMTVLEKHGNVSICGKSFGVLKLHDIDFSLPRTERSIGVGHKDFEVSVNPFMSYEDASKRRDLTVNSLMYDVITGEIIDCYNGKQDLENGVLKHVDEKTFAEDPLRVLRVAQFKSRFGFSVDKLTSAICRELIPKLSSLSKERLYGEIVKALMKSKKPSQAFWWLQKHGILAEILPELDQLHGIDQGTKHHSEGCAFTHTMLALDSIPKKERTEALMFSVLCHDLGKAVVNAERDGNSIHFFGHASAGADVAVQMMQRLTNETKLIETVANMVAHHMDIYDIKRNMTKKALRRLALKTDLKLLLKVHEADLKGRNTLKDLSHIHEILTKYDEIEKEIKPLVRGQHLIDNFNLTPGPKFGRILKEVFEAQINGEFATLNEGLEFVQRHFFAEETFINISNIKLN